ncbi:MAG: hypothetical protein HZB43_01385 [candidate division Zixibacteria bacterium]|nr:hypothetical protein [candidate division Zixibacteria bacterium]
MAKPQTPPAEQEHHRKAFELYASQGYGRSYEKVAEALGVSVAGVKKWGRTFDWRRRLQERELETARQIADRTLQTTITDQERYHKIVRMAVTKLAKAIAEDRVKLQAADLDRLIRLEDYLSQSREGGLISGVPTAEKLLNVFAHLCMADQEAIVRQLRGPEGVETAPGSG